MVSYSETWNFYVENRKHDDTTQVCGLLLSQILCPDLNWKRFREGPQNMAEWNNTVEAYKITHSKEM